MPIPAGGTTLLPFASVAELRVWLGEPGVGQLVAAPPAAALGSMQLMFV